MAICCERYLFPPQMMPKGIRNLRLVLASLFPIGRGTSLHTRLYRQATTLQAYFNFTRNWVLSQPQKILNCQEFHCWVFVKSLSPILFLASSPIMLNVDVTNNLRNFCQCGWFTNSSYIEPECTTSDHPWLRQISMKLPCAVLRKTALKFTKGSKRGKLDILQFPVVWVPSKLDI